MKKLLALVTLLLASPALAQTVTQSGTVTRNHIPYWVTSGVIGDSGSATDSPISGIGITNEGGSGLCVSSQRASAAGRQQLCFSTGTATGATITLTNLGTAPSAPLSFVIDGTTYPFPGSLSNVTIGVTPVIGGTTGQCLYISGGTVSQQNCTLSAITSLTGDVTGIGPGITVATLATVNPNIGTFGSSGLIPVITVNAKGLITSVSTTAAGITIGSSAIISGTTNGLLYANGSVVGNLATLANGALVTNGSGVPSIATTLPSALTIPSPTFTGTETFPDSATWTSSGISKAAALSVGSATIPSGGNVSISGLYMINGTQISAATGLSNGSTGSGAVVLAASPTVSGTWAGNITFSGNITDSGQDINIGTTAPASAGGQTVIMGTITSPTLSNTGQAFHYNTLVNGAILQGDGSTNDVSLLNKSGTLVVGIPTGTTKLNFPSLVSGTCSTGLGLDSSNNLIDVSCPGAASSVQVGTTTVLSGTNNFILTTGTGTLANVSFASLQTAPTFCDIISTAATTCNNGGSAANNGTYTTPTGALYLEVKWCTAGGGGGGSGSSGGGTGGTGGATTFGTSLFGGTGGVGGQGTALPGGAGGTATGGYQNVAGASGAPSGGALAGGGDGSYGGGSAYYGGGGPTSNGSGVGNIGVANTGGGGSGGGAGGGVLGGGGGGSGGCGTGIITSPSATYSYAIGAGGTAGTAGAGGSLGGVGAAGRITVTARYQ